jgi:hypothetical protein
LEGEKMNLKNNTDKKIVICGVHINEGEIGVIDDAKFEAVKTLPQVKTRLRDGLFEILKDPVDREAKARDKKVK